MASLTLWFTMSLGVLTVKPLRVHVGTLFKCDRSVTRHDVPETVDSLRYTQSQPLRPAVLRAGDNGGRYWDRTSDPCRVKAVLYR
jgi:hypothetical protein